jgi:predicted nucleic acid-binding protein
MRIVLDASVALSWLLNDSKVSDEQYAADLLDRLRNQEFEICVPALWHLEIANGVARAEQQNVIREHESEAFMNMLGALPVHTDGNTALEATGRTLNLARRYGLSAYDAAYLELALRENLPLATLNAAWRTAAERAGVALA